MAVKMQHGAALSAAKEGAKDAPAPSPTAQTNAALAATHEAGEVVEGEGHDESGDMPWHGAPLGDYQPPGEALLAAPQPAPAAPVVDPVAKAAADALALLKGNVKAPAPTPAPVVEKAEPEVIKGAVVLLPGPGPTSASVDVTMKDGAVTGISVTSAGPGGMAPGHSPYPDTDHISVDGQNAAQAVAANAKALPLYIVEDKTTGVTELRRAKSTSAALEAVIGQRFVVRKATIEELLNLLPDTIKVA